MNYQSIRRRRLLLFAAFLLIVSLAETAVNAQQGAQLSGAVTDNFSVPIRRATVRLFSSDRVLQTNSDAAGHFRLANVPTGKYELEISAPGFRTKSMAIKVGSDNESRYDIALDVSADCPPADSVSYASFIFEPPNLSGEVSEFTNTLSVSNVEVRLFHAGEKTAVATQQTNQHGEFTFGVPTPGRYFIQTSRAGYQTMTSQQFWVTTEGRTTVMMRQLKVGMMIACE